MMLSVILPSMLMILLSTPSMIRDLTYGNSWNWLLDLNLICRTLLTGTGSGLLIQCWKNSSRAFFLMLLM